jgi:hypothetical protein
MNKSFAVRIIKSSGGKFWYADKIGQVYNVDALPGLIEEYWAYEAEGYIKKVDCEAI